MKRQVALAFALALAAAPAARADYTYTDTLDDSYGEKASHKLGRGVGNVLFGWIDIFKGVEDVGEEHGAVAGATWGPIRGLGQALGRTAAGAYEIITFPIAAPGDFEPLIEPEFVLDRDRS